MSRVHVFALLATAVCVGAWGIRNSDKALNPIDDLDDHLVGSLASCNKAQCSTARKYDK